MATKLTLRMDERLILRAKTYARRSGKSVSQLVADFFVSLGSGGKRPYKVTPKVESLRGVLRGSDVGKEDYRAHLEEKYR
jgi:hypothetical protein